MWKITVLLVAIFANCAPAMAAGREEPVEYQSGDVRLAALLLLPDKPGKHPAAIIIQGSGDSDRNNLWARSIAETIRGAGYAVLLTDKRGSGSSSGDWRTVGFEELAMDALAGVTFLQSRSDIDSAAIGLVGLSQGGRVVPVAAARSAAVSFAINLVGDAVSFAEQSAHEMSNVARQSGISEADQRDVLQLNSAAGRALLSADWSEYSRLREVGLKSPWSSIAQKFPPTGDPIWTFYGKVYAFDPMPYWIQVRQPVLVVYGAMDEFDNVAVGESVRRLRFGFQASGKSNYLIHVMANVGHDLGWTRDPGKAGSAPAIVRNWLQKIHGAPNRADGLVSATGR